MLTSRRRRINLTTKKMLLKSTSSSKKSKKMKRSLKRTTGNRRWLTTKLISSQRARTKKRHLRTRLALIKLAKKTMPKVMATTLQSTWKRSSSSLLRKRTLCKKKLTPMAMRSPPPMRLLLQMKRSKSKIRRKRLRQRSRPPKAMVLKLKIKKKRTRFWKTLETTMKKLRMSKKGLMRVTTLMFKWTKMQMMKMISRLRKKREKRKIPKWSLTMPKLQPLRRQTSGSIRKLTMLKRNLKKNNNRTLVIKWSKPSIMSLKRRKQMRTTRVRMSRWSNLMGTRIVKGKMSIQLKICRSRNLHLVAPLARNLQLRRRARHLLRRVRLHLYIHRRDRLHQKNLLRLRDLLHLRDHLRLRDCLHLSDPHRLRRNHLHRRKDLLRLGDKLLRKRALRSLHLLLKGQSLQAENLLHQNNSQ